ncbi:MAG: DUF349 domain-containing protein [Proteobacteria bacterium]|nr:DUF349 domain-containing protein [Pseudomonadota bacterium]MBU1738659.1 DUF349 domain-containing protein [Pseudomonadota bacterium]
MGLLNFKKPGWQHKDAGVRLASILELDPGMTEVLISVAREDQDRAVRLGAVSRLTDLAALETLAASALEDETKSAVTGRLDEVLCSLVMASPDLESCRDLLNRITSPETIAGIAVGAEPPAIRLAAIEKISDQHLLADILRQKCGREPALAALEKISDEALLADLATTASGKAARRSAEEKRAAIEAEHFKPDPLIQREEKLTELLAGARNLVHAQDWDAAAVRLVTFRNEWQALDANGEHHSCPDFKEACTAFETRYREICHRRQEEQEKATLIQDQQTRLENICSTIEALTSSLDDAAGEKYQRATAEWEASTKEDAFRFVATEALKTRYEKCCRSFVQNQEKISEEKALFAELEKSLLEAESLLQSEQCAKARAILVGTEKRLSQTKFRVMHSGAIEKRIADLQDLLGQKESAALQNNLEKRKTLCEKLEALLESEKQTRIEKKLKTIRQEWHNLPHLDTSDGRELEKRFAEILEKFTEKQKSYYHDRDWEGWANLSVKEKLLEEAEGLDHDENLAHVFETVKALQIKWKGVGPLPRNVAQQLWERFHAACDRNFTRCQPYLEELKVLRQEAEKRREEICVRAEELMESTEWNKTAEELKTLQAEWKELLHGKRQEEDKLYHRFRKACNHFFDNRHQNFQEQEEKRRENLGKKEELCVEAEKLADEPGLDAAEKFRELQERWKKIGHVPRKKEDAIWKRFRTACDRYFSWIDEQRQDNLRAKEELCRQAEEIIAGLTEDSVRKEISSQLTALQEQWKQIGPVPNDVKDSIWQRFHAPCDEFFKAQREHFKEIEEKRMQIQAVKEEYLLQAEELGGRGIDKETTELMKELQKKWFEAGHASREVETDLNQRFKSVCDSFFAGRRQHFNDLEQERLANLKSRETLCLRLENLIGTASESVTKGKAKALSLAEQLKLAMEENFVMAGRRNDKKAVDDEVKKIQQDWAKIGPVPREHDKSIRQRFKKALDIYYAKK